MTGVSENGHYMAYCVKNKVRNVVWSDVLVNLWLSLTLEKLLQSKLLLRTKLEVLSEKRRRGGWVCGHCHHL